MATVHVSYGQVGKRGANGVIETWISGTLRSEAISSSGTSAAGTLTARKGDYAKVQCATQVVIKAGETPTATLATGLVSTAGLPDYIAMQEGEKIAVIDV